MNFKSESSSADKGFEPLLTGHEPGMLPLHQSAFCIIERLFIVLFIVYIEEELASASKG